jgi:hypothetical protein
LQLRVTSLEVKFKKTPELKYYWPTFAAWWLRGTVWSLSPRNNQMNKLKMKELHCS